MRRREGQGRHEQLRRTGGREEGDMTNDEMSKVTRKTYKERAEVRMIPKKLSYGDEIGWRKGRREKKAAMQHRKGFFEVGTRNVAAIFEELKMLLERPAFIPAIESDRSD